MVTVLVPTLAYAVTIPVTDIDVDIDTDIDMVADGVVVGMCKVLQPTHRLSFTASFASFAQFLVLRLEQHCQCFLS
jgi:hypothetical protein